MSQQDAGKLELFPLSATFLLIVYLTKRTSGIFCWGYFLLSSESLSEEYMFFLLNCECLLDVFGVV